MRYRIHPGVAEAVRTATPQAVHAAIDTELGNYLAKEMRATGYKGITTDSTYDA